MGLFDKVFGKGNHAASSQDIIETMLASAAACMEQGQYDRAAETYKKVLELQPNAIAQYNLGSLYAQGKGVAHNFMEGAYWFRQASLSGDEQAEKLCTRCIMDAVHQNLEDKTAESIYQDLQRLIAYVFPNEDAGQLTNQNLQQLAGLHFNRREYSAAAKLFRAAAEFGGDGMSQNYLGVLYNAGAGVEKNDLAALYWFDKAVDNRIEVSRRDRDGILNAYRGNLSSLEFYQQMETLAAWCTLGSEAVPKDAEKAAHWRALGEEHTRS